MTMEQRIEGDLKKDKSPDLSLWSFTLIGLYTGMRLNEIAETLITDTHPNYIYIPAGKTQNAVRNVPLHPLLKPVIKALKKSSSDSHLIDGLERGGADNKRGHNIGKRLGNVRRNKAKIIDDNYRVDFHSLRHNMKTALRNTGTEMSLIDEIVGHDNENKRPKDVYIHQANLKTLSGIVEKVTHGMKLEAHLKEFISKHYKQL